MSTQSFWTFTDQEKQLISSFVAKGKAEQAKNEKFAVIDLDSFYKLFSNDEIAIMKKYLAIDPKDLDYKLPYLGLLDTPEDIVAIPGQQYVAEGKTETIPCQYLPKAAYEAYTKLNEAMKNEIGKKVNVFYGYRSPARQIFIFFDILERIYNFDFEKTVRRVCFPAYSEHVYPHQQAIDFITDEGVCSGFEATVEYPWLKENAHKFNFTESYPEDNNLDMMYEPWHWSYKALK